MSGEYVVVVDTITDKTGDSITVSIVGDLVCLRVNEADDETPMVWLDAEQRGQFAKAWVEAERRAEAETARRAEAAIVPHIVTDPYAHRRHGCPTCLQAEA